MSSTGRYGVYGKAAGKRPGTWSGYNQVPRSGVRVVEGARAIVVLDDPLHFDVARFAQEFSAASAVGRMPGGSFLRNSSSDGSIRSIHCGRSATRGD